MTKLRPIPTFRRTLPWIILTQMVLVAMTSAQMNGPLRIHPVNPRYLTDESGKSIYLAGAHTWANGPDTSPSDPPEVFDYPRYLEWLKGYGHNFFKLWVTERSKWDPEYPKPIYFSPVWYERTGPGQALDDKPKFDLDRFHEPYFTRLSDRIAKAQAAGLYVAVMLFDDWSVRRDRAEYTDMDPWQGHPYHKANNVNGVDGDVNRDGRGEETHKLPAQGGDPRVFAYQVAYVKRVIDAVNDFDNVIYEVCNEAAYAENLPWQNALADTIRAYQARKPKQHLIGITGDWYADNDGLWSSRADYVAFADERVGDAEGYANDPADPAGVKVVINDTDHMWGARPAPPEWAWKSFTRGIHILDMDQYDGRSGIGGTVSFDSTSEPIRSLRLNMGAILRYAQRMDLAATTPSTSFSSTRYSLAGRGEYLVFQPENGAFSVDLTVAQGRYALEWYRPWKHETIDGGEVRGGAVRLLQPPFSGLAVAYLRSVDSSASTEQTGPPETYAIEEATRVPGDDDIVVQYVVRPSPGVPSWSADAPQITLALFDAQGREVHTLRNRPSGPGRHRQRFVGRSLVPGVYFVRMEVRAVGGKGIFSRVKKLAWVK